MSICQDIPKSANIIDLRHCTIGATVGRHPGAPNELFMGGPYFYYGKGMGVMLDTQKFTHSQTSTEGLLPNMLIGSSLDISDRIFAPRSGSDRQVYAAYGGPGVPVIDNTSEKVGTGTVLFFPNSKDTEEINIRPVLRIDGQKFGSRFGHSLILVDINGDSWEDLIVGAPYEKLEALAGSQSEYGAVHVFLNLQSNFSSPVNDLSGESPFAYQPRSAHQLLTPLDKNHDCGTTPISAYGSTLVELGDINHDGFQDFAVGAPYGAGGGIVFIYHGSKTGRIGLPAQVICTAKLAIQNTLSGFGFSMGLKGLDLDGNGYADMAIGAPLSDSVVVLRSRPIIKFDAHITLEDGSTVIPTNLDTLSDCTMEALTLPGYKARKVRCLDTKIFMTYTSIDGLPCKYGKRYKVSLLLKADPVDAWLAEWTEPDDDQTRTVTRDRRKVAGQCALSDKSTGQQVIPNVFQIYRELAIAPVSFIGEKSVLEFGNQSDPFFTVNKSANSAGVQSPGGYLSVELEATCRELSDVPSKTLPHPEEMAAAKKLRLVFRDVNLIDQTRPIAIGVRWVAHTPPPFPMANNIHEFPISNPRENSQLIKLTFDNQCTAQICCPHLRVTYSVDITRDKNGPVVYVGDDNAQTIQIKVQVTNMGVDPAYMLNLVSNYPPNLLELDPSVQSHVNVAPNAASCHLANPLWPGQSAECTLRWLVIGHQLAVQMAQFSVNSSVVVGTEAPVTVEGSLTHELRVNIKMIANISITGIIDPNTVYFSGNVSDGISSILAENQIGDSQLLIKFTVRNHRIHSLIPDSRLIVDWPYEIAGDVSETHGKYMLYLLENPSVVQHQLIIPGESVANTSSVVCDSLALTRLVNPHGYRIFSFLKPSVDGVPVQTAPVELPSGHPPTYPPLSSTMVIEDVPERLADSKQREKRKMTTVSCYNGQLRCIPIVCDLGKLSYKAGPITLEFNARLWDNTMREEFKPVFLTKLHISATWRANVKYGIDLGDSDHAQNIVSAFSLIKTELFLENCEPVSCIEYSMQRLPN
ncbi:hypothetical protein P879_04050 [Paragonimus westermani]|uniref:Integrin alpha third immunoglobulin-like domain-containing protein n=1 Tax=Paragonimus westermani TaxID=34504 RepID=A0A8T0DQV0_9TREM|nr:hypothetical protein P879_04050 [Paragonimus westermani]